MSALLAAATTWFHALWNHDLSSLVETAAASDYELLLYKGYLALLYRLSDEDLHLA